MKEFTYKLRRILSKFRHFIKVTYKFNLRYYRFLMVLIKKLSSILISTLIITLTLNVEKKLSPKKNTLSK